MKAIGKVSDYACQIRMTITVIGGLLPAKKDPVIALRTE